MKKLTLILTLVLSFNLILFSQNKEDIKPYIQYLNKNKLPDAKNYILDLFKQYDIVVLCERMHPEYTQYNLITDLIKDEYFRNNVGTVFTEIGVNNMNPALNDFLHTDNISQDSVDKKIVNFQTNCSFYAIWENYNYYYLLSSIYNLNNNSPEKISVYPSDLTFDWSQIKDSTDYKNFVRANFEMRDSIIAENIIDTYKQNKNHKKALVILNYRHAFNKNFVMGKNEIKNTTKYLFDYFGNRIANVLISPVMNKTGAFELIQNGKWDAAFKDAGINDAGFNFKDNVFGKDSFDLWVGKTPYTYQDMFTGFVFYQQIEDQKLISGYSGLINKNFENEFIRRWNISATFFKKQKQIQPNSSESEEIFKFLNNKREKNYFELDSILKDRNKYLKEK